MVSRKMYIEVFQVNPTLKCISALRMAVNMELLLVIGVFFVLSFPS
jgi:hypothetical protein